MTMHKRAFLLVALLTAGTTLAEDAPVVVTVAVGGTHSVCGFVRCPVVMAICDDPKVAVVENAPYGAVVVKGVGRGSTLCSVRGDNFSGFQVMKVNVQ